jgi:hypothetical protein
MFAKPSMTAQVPNELVEREIERSGECLAYCPLKFSESRHIKSCVECCSVVVLATSLSEV